MWKCKSCGEQLEDQFGACWKCGSSRDESPQQTPGFETLAEELASEAAALAAESPGRVKYDAVVICRYADFMYLIALLLTVLWILVGLAAGYLVGRSLESQVWPGSGSTVIGTVVGALLGLLIGQAIASWYRLAAQVALCQVEIEKNTRKGAASNRRALAAKSAASGA